MHTQTRLELTDYQLQDLIDRKKVVRESKLLPGSLVGEEGDKLVWFTHKDKSYIGWLSSKILGETNEK